MTTRLKPLLTLAALTTLLALPGIAQAASCPNEEFRTGPSASLPDCRAYELVTPEELGRTQAITFTSVDSAIASTNGEHLALSTFAPLEPGPSLKGTRAVFSRTPQGWTARSIVTPEVAALQIAIARHGILSPELSQVAFVATSELNAEDILTAPREVEVGPVGGPYTLVANLPALEPGLPPGYETGVAGANAGTASVPAFTDVLFETPDRQLLPSGPEREVAEEVEPGAYDLYDWTGGALRLVNVEGEGSHVKPLNNCGANLGAGGPTRPGATTVGAVSADGSKIFFTSCGRLYMRVEGRETVEVSKPAPGVELNPSERRPVNYNAATPDGSEVVFNTATPLLTGETASEDRLFMYDTVTGELMLIRSGVEERHGTEGRFVLLSEDGSAVYYNVDESIYRYETQTGKTSFVAAIATPEQFNEPSYTTPDGQSLVFVSSGRPGVEVAGPHGLELEPRGAAGHHEQLYRYDAADGSVMCVSCGEGVAPAEGEVRESNGVLETQDEVPPFIQMSENGQRVFFETTAQLVPQDTNSTSKEGAGGSSFPGMDVYEWEADGAEEGLGVICRVVVGCTHLISSGEDVGKATLLGASENGDNVFFATAARLVPQATPEFPNIYDARVGGGFPPRQEPRECLSCQGVGSTAPLFGPGASLTFAGPGNPVVAPAGKEKPESKPKSKPKRRRKKRTSAKRATGRRKGGRRS